MKLLTLPVLVFLMFAMTACVFDAVPDIQQAISTVEVTDESTDTQNNSVDANSTTTESDVEQASTNTSEISDTSTTIEAVTGEENASTETPIIDPEETTVEETTVDAQEETASWLRIPMHFEVLLGQSHIWGEAGGTSEYRLASPALAESSMIELNSTRHLLPLQLISYYGDDGEYYSAQIQNIENKTLLLTTPLKQSISAGTNVWNFYSDGSHPNSRGYNVIADFAVRFLGKGQLNEGTHVLLGDSWFDDSSIFERLKHHLPEASIINEGVGGNTAANLLERFDEDVLPHTPNFVWIMTSTNDYWQDVSAETYKSNIDSLISQIKAANAIPIVFDASVGPLNSGEDTITLLSQSYVTAIDQLLASEN